MLVLLSYWVASQVPTARFSYNTFPHCNYLAPFSGGITKTTTKRETFGLSLNLSFNTFELQDLFNSWDVTLWPICVSWQVIKGCFHSLLASYKKKNQKKILNLSLLWYRPCNLYQWFIFSCKKKKSWWRMPGNIKSLKGPFQAWLFMDSMFYVELASMATNKKINE